MTAFRFVLTAALILSSAIFADARLGESPAECELRYGPPVPPPGGNYPLLDGAEELVYQHEGWNIRTAFVNGEAARIEYSKIRQPDDTGTVVIQSNEICDLLNAEKGDGSWTEQTAQIGDSPFSAFDQLMDNTKKWINADGATATLKNNRLILLFDTPVAQEFEAEQRSTSTSGL